MTLKSLRKRIQRKLRLKWLKIYDKYLEICLISTIYFNLFKAYCKPKITKIKSVSRKIVSGIKDFVSDWPGLTYIIISLLTIVIVFTIYNPYIDQSDILIEEECNDTAIYIDNPVLTLTVGQGNIIYDELDDLLRPYKEIHFFHSAIREGDVWYDLTYDNLAIYYKSNKSRYLYAQEIVKYLYYQIQDIWNTNLPECNVNVHLVITDTEDFEFVYFIVEDGDFTFLN